MSHLDKSKWDGWRNRSGDVTVLLLHREELQDRSMRECVSGLLRGNAPREEDHVLGLAEAVRILPSDHREGVALVAVRDEPAEGHTDRPGMNAFVLRHIGHKHQPIGVVGQTLELDRLEMTDARLLVSLTSLCLRMALVRLLEAADDAQVKARTHVGSDLRDKTYEELARLGVVAEGQGHRPASADLVESHAVVALRTETVDEPAELTLEGHLRRRSFDTIDQDLPTPCLRGWNRGHFETHRDTSPILLSVTFFLADARQNDVKLPCFSDNPRKQCKLPQKMIFVNTIIKTKKPYFKGF